MPQRREATVTQINNYMKVLVERTDVLQNLWIKGEISNLKVHSSGHIYLTLKDEGSNLKAVMFKSAAMKLPFKAENGMKVSANGRIGVFEREGTYQLYIENMEQDGQGDLYVKLEQLKKKLSAEGLFDPKYKKPIPAFPKRVGIVTSPTGAAIRDILNVIKRRYSAVEVFLYPALVQGSGAAKTIVKGIEFFNKNDLADVLIVGRGGGSIEDLWAFNEEETVRGIFNSKIPIISAVGHETDFTLSDAAADLRAPTPSAAAELSVPDKEEIIKLLDKNAESLKNLLLSKAKEKETRFALIAERATGETITRKIENLMQYTDTAFDNLLKSYNIKIDKKTSSLGEAAGKLDALSPLKVFDRGYCVAKSGGKLVRKCEDVSLGDSVDIILKDGKITTTVISQ